MTKREFVARLSAVCPETQPIVDEHLADFDNEILLHVLIADVRRFSIASFEGEHTEVLKRCLDVVGIGMSDGDDSVRNAIGVSFVEDTPLWDPEMGPLSRPGQRRSEMKPSVNATGDKATPNFSCRLIDVLAFCCSNAWDERSDGHFVPTR